MAILFMGGVKMQSCEFASTVTAIACLISKCCSEDELLLAAAFFTQLGDTLATMITYEEFNNKNVEI
jgi:hypothetical protein